LLFTFLLVVPFNDRFRDLSRFDQRLYLATPSRSSPNWCSPARPR